MHAGQLSWLVACSPHRLHCNSESRRRSIAHRARVELTQLGQLGACAFPVSGRRLYIGRIPQEATRADFEDYFGRAGKLIDVRIMAGFAFLEYDDLRVRLHRDPAPRGGRRAPPLHDQLTRKLSSHARRMPSKPCRTLTTRTFSASGARSPLSYFVRQTSPR
jgi:hypothetical protein